MSKPKPHRGPKPDPLTRPPLPRPRKGQPLPGDDDPHRDALRKRAGVEDHLQYVHKLLKQYKLAKRDHVEIFATLKHIDEHEKERRLFLGVVGEFSSGKSTLINALIRDPLLRTDVLQGTTAAATLLTAGPKLFVHVRHRRRNIIVRSFLAMWWMITLPVLLFRKRPGRPELVELIHKASADEKFARRVVQVNVQHPAESLQQGLVIVDLPGTNAENPRHGLVTAQALRELCDAAIIVIPADTPGSDTMLNFLADHLEEDVLRRCAFVLNKIDLIRPMKERERLAENVRNRLRQRLKVPNPKVLPAAPQLVLESLPDAPPPEGEADALSPEERETWLRRFGETEAALWRFLREQKVLLQIERLTRLLDQLFGQLDTTLRQHEHDYQERHEALLNNQIPDLRGFLAEHRDKHVQTYLKGTDPIGNQVGKNLAIIRSTTMKVLAQTVFNTSSKKELEAAVREGVPSVLNTSQNQLRKTVRLMIEAMEEIAENEHRKFHAHFQKLYRSLATLGGKIDVGSGRLGSMAAADFGSTASSAHHGAAVNIKGELSAEQWKIGGAAAGGALIGTLVLPGIGTAIGALAGGLLSLLFGPSLGELQQRCWGQIEPQVLNSFEKFFHTAGEIGDRAEQEIAQRLGKTIDKYGTRYAKLVEEMKQRDRDEAVRLEKLRKQVHHDLDEIGDRKERLAITREELRAI